MPHHMYILPHHTRAQRLYLHLRWWLRQQNRLTRSIMRILWHAVVCCLHGLIIGLACGLIIGIFRTLQDTARPLLATWIHSWPDHMEILAVWAVLLTALARVLGQLVKTVPLISGGGIPQTELVIMGRLHIPRFVWLKVLGARFCASLLSPLGGLSLGREGPCVQMGGAVAGIVSSLWDHVSFRWPEHIAAGAAAGIAAAFCAPLAGVLFVFEEVKCRFDRGGIAITLCAAYASDAVARKLYGYGPLFPLQQTPSSSIHQLWLLGLLGILLGLAGTVYNRGLIVAKDTEAHYNPLPQQWRLLPPLTAAWCLTFTLPCVLGGGEQLILSLATSSYPLTILCIIVGIKILFSLLSFTGNAPGGILMPMLCIGGGLGVLFGQILLSLELVPQSSTCWMIFGMTGFFAAVRRAPLTGLALVMAMTGASECLPGCLLVSFLAHVTANSMSCPPIYDSLRAAIVLPKIL